jgi:hypothetical protein
MVTRVKYKVFSGYWSHWPLADALKWRTQQWKCSLPKAFREVALLCAEDPDRVFATGVLIGSHPERPRGWDFPPFEPFATPSRLPSNTPNLGRIPAEDWSDLEPAADPETGQPTNQLNYASVKRPAWSHVEFNEPILVEAWMPLIRETEKGRRRNQATAVTHGRLVRFFKDMKLQIPPSQAKLKSLAEQEFKSLSVTNTLVKDAQETVWGKQRRGPRGKRQKAKAAE